MDELLNKKVKVIKQIFGNTYIGKVGVVTSIGKGESLPIHVTLDGDKYETDFTVGELEVLQ